MQLKEFDLDLPYIVNEEKIQLIMKQNNCSHNDATKMDYESNWKEKRRKFRLNTRCISSMFERLFGKFITKNCCKLLIECVPEVAEHELLDFSGIYSVKVLFDYNNFIEQNEYQKKKMTLEILMEGIRIVAENQKWDVEPFKDVYSRILELDFINEWAWKKPVVSSNKKYHAEVMMLHDVRFIDIYIIVRDTAGNEIKREKIISELPDEFAYARHLGDLKWTSNDTVTLINKKGDFQWPCSLE